MNILLTGATGFVGSRLGKALHSKPNVTLTAVVRRRVEIPADHIVEIQGLDAVLIGQPPWSVNKLSSIPPRVPIL